MPPPFQCIPGQWVHPRGCRCRCACRCLTQAVLDALVPELNPDEAVHADALVALIREVFGDNIGSLAAGDGLGPVDLQALVESLTAGNAQEWYTGVREAFMREVVSAVQDVAGLSAADRDTLVATVRAILDKVWERVLVRAEALVAAQQ